MKAHMQLMNASIAAVPHGRASEPRPDAHREEGFYEHWKAIFENARPVEIARDEADRSGAGTSGFAFRFGEAIRDVPMSASNVRGQLGIAHIPTPATAATQRESHGLQPGPEMHAGSSASPGSARLAPMLHAYGTSGTLRSVASAPDSDVRSQSGISSSIVQGAVQAWAGAAQHVSAESISVFVRGAAVAIVLRDAALSNDQALHCAFETARELTGQRAGLQQLTMNGRVVYRQGESDSRSRALLFAC